jgi:Kef-type K+ transport system membrane component KefB
MENSVYLRDLVIILAVAVGVVAVLHRFKIPSIAGFILAGVIVGPQALGIISDVHEVEVLAEVGVALLLFGIGLEMSLERLRRLWWPILVGGFLQVGLTVILAFLSHRHWGLYGERRFLSDFSLRFRARPSSCAACRCAAKWMRHTGALPLVSWCFRIYASSR